MKASTKDQAAGTLHAVKGAIKEAAGKLTDNPKLKGEGLGEKLAGKVQKKIGQVETVLEKQPGHLLKTQKEIIMERRTNGFVFPVKIAVVMVALFSAVFLANATPSQAASGKKKPEAAKTNVEQTESRIKRLNTALKITPEQDVLWSNMTQVMRENAKNSDAMSVARAETAGTMNAVERIKLHSQITEAQLDQQKKFIPVFEAFYASLSDVQKATIDTIFRTGRHGKHAI